MLAVTDPRPAARIVVITMDRSSPPTTRRHHHLPGHRPSCLLYSPRRSPSRTLSPSGSCVIQGDQVALHPRLFSGLWSTEKSISASSTYIMVKARTVLGTLDSAADVCISYGVG